MLGPMTEPLDRLVGMSLLAAASDSESVGLQFSGCDFSAYSKTSASRPIAGLIGLTVRSVVYATGDSLTLRLGEDDSFALSLRPNDYVGPEAFCARFAHGPWVIE